MGAKKDHYVARTYLKSFSVPNKPGLVNVLRKSNLQRLNEVHVGTICHVNNWSTNEYFAGNERLVEDYLQHYEPKWNGCVDVLRQAGFNFDTKQNMAGYIAYLRACTPTAARLAHISAEETAQLGYDIIERMERKKVSAELREQIEKDSSKYGAPQIQVNENFPKALGIKGLPKLQERLLNFRWIILRNETGIPFLTSDNPVCLNYENGRDCCDIYCPITSEIAVIIESAREQTQENDALAKISVEGVVLFNELIVKSAEDMVIFGDASNAEVLVHKFRDWQVGQLIIKIPEGSGTMLVSQQRAMKQVAPASKPGI